MKSKNHQLNLLGQKGSLWRVGSPHVPLPSWLCAWRLSQTVCTPLTSVIHCVQETSESVTLRSHNGAGFGFDIYSDNSGAIAVQSLQSGGSAQESGLIHPGKSRSRSAFIQSTLELANSAVRHRHLQGRF